MKSKILLFIFFITTITYAQKIEGTIHFNDGTQKSGYIKYGPKAIAKNIKTTDNVKFFKTKNSNKKVEFKYSNISKIDLTKNGDLITTIYFKVYEKDPNIIFDVTLEHEGHVSLYKNTHFDNYGYIIETYFVQKDDQNIVKIFPVGVLGNGSDKAMKNYFIDCPKLLELIDRRAFRMYFANKPSLEKSEKFKNRLIEIVKYYNTKCAK